MDELMRILNELRPDVDFSTYDSLTDGDILDSFDIVMLVGELNQAFDIRITAADISEENFHSAEAIMALIRKHQD